MKCPWPVLRAARAAREAGGEGSIRILADDPIAPAELARLCDERGWRLEPDAADPTAFVIHLNSHAVS